MFGEKLEELLAPLLYLFGPRREENEEEEAFFGRFFGLLYFFPQQLHTHKTGSFFSKKTRVDLKPAILISLQLKIKKKNQKIIFTTKQKNYTANTSISIEKQLKKRRERR